MNDDVISPAIYPRNEMTEEEYERRRAEHRQRYGNRHADARSRSEQELARLFYDTNWSQEKLAAKEGLSVAHISAKLIFGRFLDYSAMAENAPDSLKTLSERRFRTFFRQTESGNERKRFRQVIDLMEADALIEKANAGDLAKKIIEEYGDGEWHQFASVVDFLSEDEKVCVAALDKVGKNKTFNCKVERKPYGASFKFVIYQQHDAISVVELVQKLGPIIKELVEEGKKGPARISGAQVTTLAVKLQRLLDEWNE